MKRTIVTVILALCLLFGTISESLYGQNNTPIDLVLLLDTSSGMSSSYDNVSNYLTGPFLREFLRVGDTFHLIVFSGTQRLDVSRRISGVGDVETIIGRMLIQYPIENASNVGAAISFTEQYLNTLPNRSKKIVVVAQDNTASNNLITAARGRLSSRNTTIDFVQVTPGQPLRNLPVSNRPASAQTARPVQTDTTTIDSETVSIIESDTENNEIDETAETEDSIDSYVYVAEETNESDGSVPLYVFLIILIILLVLGLLIFLLTRRLSSNPNRVMADVAGANEDSNLSNYASGQNKQRTTPYDNRPSKLDIGKPVVINPAGPLLLNLFVNEQNTAIGKRNIHSLKSGYSLTVGGGKSDDFYIFLVPMPANIGEIRRNGSQLTFVPKRPKYFPDLKSGGEVKDCINKQIRIVSDKNYEVRFSFEMYEDPLVALNRLLHSVKVPG